MPETAAPGTPYIPEPVLHSYTDERGFYEDATFWNPSWTLARGAVQYTTIRDTLAGFRAVGQGQRLKPATFQAMLAPQTPGMKFWTNDMYYAQGIVVNKGWFTQAPSFAGLFGTAGYHPAEDITIALWCTRSIDASSEGNPVSALYQRLTEILTSEN